MKVVTTHIYPPIPLRTFDWCAHFEGEEERGGYGYGRTEQEALADLAEIWRDRADAEREAHEATIRHYEKQTNEAP
jgi:hypothetical protein